MMVIWTTLLAATLEIFSKVAAFFVPFDLGRRQANADAATKMLERTSRARRARDRFVTDSDYADRVRDRFTRQ